MIVKEEDTHREKMFYRRKTSYGDKSSVSIIKNLILFPYYAFHSNTPNRENHNHSMPNYWSIGILGI